MVTFKLKTGEIVMVDDEDFMKISEFTWFIDRKNTRTNHPVVRAEKINGKWTKIPLHKHLKDTPKGMRMVYKDKNNFLTSKIIQRSLQTC